MTRELAIKVIKRMIKTGIAYDDGYAFEPLAKDEEKACAMAIKALEQEPCSNCIEFKRYAKQMGFEIEQEPKWIPVSERLPEEDGSYLTYIINPYEKRIRYMMVCEYSVRSNDWFPDDETASNNVVAWMPLPKPYSEVSE